MMMKVGRKVSSKKCVKCQKNDVWRILLRNCNHVICIGCLMEYLRIQIKHKQKARIKCPKKSCKFRVHENDVRALLNKENPDLDTFMIPSQRDWLLFHHDQDVLRYALGGDKFSRQCPLCLNFYAKLDGCNYVRCANIRCNQWFCFNCGDPVKSWQHFAQNRCKVGWDDVFKLTYFLRFFLTLDSITNIFIFPFIAIAMLIFTPLYVTIGFPYYCFKNFLIVSQVFKALDFATIILQLLGYGNWKQIIQDSKAAKMELEIEELQERDERSEELNSVEKKTRKAVRKSRRTRASGGQANDGAVNIGKFVEKGLHNVEAVKKGKLRDIRITKFNDIKVNSPLKVIKHAPKANKARKLSKLF